MAHAGQELALGTRAGLGVIAGDAQFGRRLAAGDPHAQHVRHPRQKLEFPLGAWMPQIQIENQDAQRLIAMEDGHAVMPMVLDVGQAAGVAGALAVTVDSRPRGRGPAA